jgi:hypothetical protein
MAKSKPIPDRGTNAPVGSALLLTVRLPLRGPALLGANSTPAVQLAPEASVAGQALFTSLKPAVTARTKFERLAAPLGLVKVTVTGLLSRPTPTSEAPEYPVKSIKLGCAWTEPGTPPVPLSATLAEAASEGDAMVSVPVYGPLSGGEKRTAAEQLVPAARVEAQVFCVRLNGGVAVSASELAVEPPVLVMLIV